MMMSTMSTPLPYKSGCDRRRIGFVLMRREARKLQTAQDHFDGQRCLHRREEPKPA
jgi:hypothetical protein